METNFVSSWDVSCDVSLSISVCRFCRVCFFCRWKNLCFCRRDFFWLAWQNAIGFSLSLKLAIENGRYVKVDFSFLTRRLYGPSVGSFLIVDLMKFFLVCFEKIEIDQVWT